MTDLLIQHLLQCAAQLVDDDFLFQVRTSVYLRLSFRMQFNFRRLPLLSPTFHLRGQRTLPTVTTTTRHMIPPVLYYKSQ
jgi:hypothetical protein